MKSLKPGLRPETLFLALSLGFGFALALITAPFQAPDEPAHFLRIWQLSERKLVADHYGGSVPTSLCDCYVRFLPLANHPESKTRVREIADEFHRPLDPSKREFIPFANTAIYSPVPYFPQTLALLAGRALSLPPIALMYLGRCASALAYTLLGWLSLRILPILKWPACLVLLSPLPLFLAGSLSADPVTIALAFLATASTLSLMTVTDRAPGGLLMLFAVATIGTALCKWTYLPAVILVVAVPRRAWGNSAWSLLFPIGVGVCAIAAFATWSNLSQPMHVPLRNGDPLPQLHWICSHPLGYAGVLGRTVRVEFSTLAWTSIGVLGWLDIRLSPVFIGLYLLLIIWAVQSDLGEFKISNRARLLAGTGVFSSLIAIATCEYLVWNTTGNPIIEGIQGRYLLPLALLAFVAIRRQGSRRVPTTVLGGAALGGATLASCIYTIFAVIHRHYAY